MKKTRQNSSRVALIALLLLLFPITLVSAQTVTIDNLKYTLKGDMAVVIRPETQPTGDLVIPNSIEQGGKSYQVTAIASFVFQNCSGLTSVTFPEGLTTIGGYAFFGCSGLTSITLPDGLTFIGDYAFQSCSGLTSVTFPESLTTIGKSAFYSCRGLTSVTLSESLTTIGESAFSNCSGLTSVTFPEGLTTIGERAFYSCSGLTSVTFPEGLTTIGERAFYSCSGLTAFTISDKNQYYSAIDGVLFNKDQSKLICYPIKKEGSAYTVPTSVETIGGYAFSSCRGLTSVTLSESLTTIGESAFYSCSGLKELHVPIAIPIAISSSSFNYVSTATCKLYVPVGSKAAYQVAEVWNDFQNIVEESPAVSGIADAEQSAVRVAVVAGRIVVDGVPEGATIEVYSLSGQLVACTTNTEIELPQRGVYIVRVGGVSFKINF